MKFSLTTGMNELQNNDGELKVIPNPFNEFTTISTSENFNNPVNVVELFDLTGRKLRKEIFSSSQFIFNRNDLAEGVYVLRITNAHGIMKSAKLIID